VSVLSMNSLILNGVASPLSCSWPNSTSWKGSSWAHSAFGIMIMRKFLLASVSLILLGLHHASADRLDLFLKCQTDAGPHPSFQELIKCDKQFLDKNTLDQEDALFERVAIKFTAYRTVSICADNNIGYNQHHSEVLMKAIKSDPDIVTNIGPLYKVPFGILCRKTRLRFIKTIALKLEALSTYTILMFF
jgi:hypothetical protein